MCDPKVRSWLARSAQVARDGNTRVVITGTPFETHRLSSMRNATVACVPNFFGLDQTMFPLRPTNFPIFIPPEPASTLASHR